MKIVNTMWKDIISISKILVGGDPCKKCIVRACCSQKCKEKTYHSNLREPGGSIIIPRLYTSVIVFECIALFYVLCQELFS